MDDNRIIIDNVNFNRNLPKWATDDTLSRMEKMVGKSHKESQKSLNEVLKTLKTISNKDADLFKETQNSNKEIKKELSKLTKILAQNNTTSKASSNKATTNKNDETASGIKKTNATLDKGFKSLDASVNDAIDSILSGNSETSRHLSDANKAHDKVADQLLKIYDELKNIGSGGTSSSAESKDKNDNNRSGDTGKTNSLLGDIKNILSRQSTVQQQMYSRTLTDTDFERVMDNNSKRTADEFRDATQSSMGGLSDMLSTAVSRVDSGQGTSGQKALSGVIAGLAGTIGTLSKVIRMTPLGRMASVAMASYAAANKTFEYAYDVQGDFRNMIDRGFNFSQLSEDVGTERLDGISMRRTILRNDIGLETATQILEKNTRLLNEVGFSSMFGELGTIVGDIDDPNSVTNRLGMTRDQVALIATDFYAMHRRINSITKDFTAIERQQLASQFVENVRRMSQQLGVGIPQIREAIEQFTNTGRFTRTSAFLGAEQSESIAMLGGMISNVDLAPSLQEAFLTAATSVAGINDPAVMEIIGRDPLTLQAFSEFSEEFRNARNMDSGELLSFLSDFTDRAVQILDDNGGAAVEALSIDSGARQSIEDLSTIRSIQQQLNQSTSDLLMGGQEDVSPLAAAARELENMGILIDARTEEMFASAADSSVGREVLANMLSVDEIMKRSQLALIDLTKSVVTGLFDGPIPTILRTIQRMIERVFDIVGWMTGRRHTGGITGSDADGIINAIQNNVLGKEAFESIFSETEVDGQTVYNVQEGISGEDLKTFFDDIYSNADTREDREAIAGVVRSLSRGIEGRESRVGEDVRDLMGGIEESFLGMASSSVTGTEREALIDAFSGFEDSTELLGTRLFDNVFEPGKVNQFTGARITEDGVSEYAPGVRERENRSLVDTSMTASVEALENRRQMNLNQERLEREQERIRNRGSIDRGVLDNIVDMFPAPEDITVETPNVNVPEPDVSIDRGVLDGIVDMFPQRDDEMSIDGNSINQMTRRLEENSRTLDIEWLNNVMNEIHSASTQDEPMMSPHEDSMAQTTRPLQSPVSATIEQHRPRRYEEDIDSKSIVEELKKQEEDKQYSQQVRQAGAASFNEFTQNTQQNETINNTQDDSGMSEALVQISLTQQRLAEGFDRNSRALERYLATKT